jgi:hypothetical protein
LGNLKTDEPHFLFGRKRGFAVKEVIIMKPNQSRTVRLGDTDIRRRISLSRTGRFTAYLVGGGSADYPIPSVEALVAGAQEAIEAIDFVLITGLESEEGESVPLHPHRPFPAGAKPLFIVTPPKHTGGRQLSPFRRRVEGWEQAQSANEFVAAVAARFDADEYLLTVEKVKLPPEMQATADNLLRQLLPLRDRVTRSLPRVVSKIRKKYPDATPGQVYATALKLIDQQLLPLLSTIYIWTTGLRQWLNPKYNRKMRILRASIEQKLFLLLTGNLNVKDPKDLKEQIDTIAVKVGDLVIPVLIGPEDGGPAVYPMTGQLGPQGAHAMLFLQSLINFIALIDAVYSHEMGHLFFAVVVGLAEALVQLVEDTIRKAHKDGKLKFTSEEVEIAEGVKVPTVDFAVKVFIDHLDELFADLMGQLVSGPPAFSAAFADYIGSASSREQGGVAKAGPLFSSGSDYSFEMEDSGDWAMDMEPHPQDNVRLQWQAFNARKLKFTATAKSLEQLRKDECGSPAPAEISWENDSDEEEMATDFEIRWAVSDYNQVSELLSNVVPNAKLEPLNEMSLSELVCFTPEMQKEKVDKLVALIKAGIGKLPHDGRKYWLHFVGAAAILAYDELVDEGLAGDRAISIVAKASEEMMSELTDQWDLMKESYDLYHLDDSSDDSKAA